MLLGGAPLVRSAGRAYPVETRYVPFQRHSGGTDAARGIEPAVAAAVRRALADEPEGDVLVFLPGAGEIRRVETLLRGSGLESGGGISAMAASPGASDGGLGSESRENGGRSGASASESGERREAERCA